MSTSWPRRTSSRATVAPPDPLPTTMVLALSCLVSVVISFLRRPHSHAPSYASGSFYVRRGKNVLNLKDYWWLIDGYLVPIAGSRNTHYLREEAHHARLHVWGLAREAR